MLNSHPVRERAVERLQVWAGALPTLGFRKSEAAAFHGRSTVTVNTHTP